MRKPTLFPTAPDLATVSSILAAAQCFANPITYTEQVTASGSFGGVAFTDADVVLTMTNDTVNVKINRFGLPEILGVAAVSVAGGMANPFANSVRVFSTGSAVGFTEVFPLAPRRSIGADILETSNLSAFGGYDLKTSIGPIPGTARFNPGFAFPTTDGDLILNSVSGDTSTFTAATVSGDPHFTTYGGVRYDYQGLGDFVLARSTVPGDQFDVQVRTRSYADATTTISEAAAALCNHRITFDVDRSSAGGSFVWIDDHASSFSANNPVLTLDGCEVVELAPVRYRVVWDTGEILDVTNTGTYLDLSSWLSWIDGPGSVEGPLSSDVNPDAWRVTEGSLLDPVPEPGTLFLLASALAGLALTRRCCRGAPAPRPDRVPAFAGM
jgi:PEP-CTERM motif-containing protein/VWD domain-containing protein